MRVFELARAYDAKVSDVQLEGRFIGLKDLRPHSELARYQADEIARRLIQRGQARRPSSDRVVVIPRKASDFRGLPPVEQEIMALLDRPNRDANTADVSQINLRQLREGLGMSVQLAAAVLGVRSADLERWEIDPRTPAWQICELLGAYAVHMAATWGFDQLRLSAQNFEDIIRVPPEPGTQRTRRSQQDRDRPLGARG